MAGSLWQRLAARPVVMGVAVAAATFGAGTLLGMTLTGGKPPRPETPPIQLAAAAVPRPPAAPPALVPVPPAPTGPTETAPWEQDEVPKPSDKPRFSPLVAPPTAPPPGGMPVTPAALRPPAVPLPPVASPDSPPWLKNAVPFTLPPNRPAIAIVIDDLGLDRRRSARVTALPAPLTLAWMPYARDLGVQTRAAHAAGHELMVHMPMEPEGSEDPGPGAMLVGLPRDELLRRLDIGLASFDGYIGVNNHMGSKFTADRPGMAVVLSDLQRRGLMFLDSRTTPHSAAPGVAREIHLPSIGRDVFLDNRMTPDSVRASLAQTEQVARRQGYAIAIGHPHEVTIDALAEWLPTAAARGFTLAPVSAILRARTAMN